MVCLFCNAEFQKNGYQQVYCSSRCRQRAKHKRRYATEEGRRKCIERVRRYQRTEKGKQNFFECKRRYLQTEKGKLCRANHNKRYAQTGNGKRNSRERTRRFLNTERGKQYRKEWLASDKARESRERYLKSEKGKTMLRRRAEKLGWSNLDWKDIENYWIYVEKYPCSVCKEKNQALLQCDHIIPRALWVILYDGNMEGCHIDSNLHILCKSCHKSKTAEDMKLIRATKEMRKLEVVVA